MTTVTAHPDVDDTRAVTATAPRSHRRALVNGARVALLMLLVAGIAMLGLGVAALVLVDPPEVSGWLRSVFGTVFGYMAIAMAAVLGTPAAVGVWAMAGANTPDAMPALSPRVQRAALGLAVLAVVVTAVIVLGARSGISILDLALVGLVALLAFGLAGAVAFSPHRGRATAGRGGARPGDRRHALGARSRLPGGAPLDADQLRPAPPVARDQADGLGHAAGPGLAVTGQDVARLEALETGQRSDRLRGIRGERCDLRPAPARWSRRRSRAHRPRTGRRASGRVSLRSRACDPARAPPAGSRACRGRRRHRTSPPR